MFFGSGMADKAEQAQDSVDQSVGAEQQHQRAEGDAGQSESDDAEENCDRSAKHGRPPVAHKYEFHRMPRCKKCSSSATGVGTLFAPTPHSPLENQGAPPELSFAL